MLNDIQLLTGLGWGPHFHSQLTPEEWGATLPHRVMAVHRGQLVLSNGGEDLFLDLAGKILTEDRLKHATIGDWVVIERLTGDFLRVLDRKSLFKRKAAGSAHQHQLVAANVDTLFIVTSCNDEFNLSRLERYLALSYDSEVEPLIILTKADLCLDPGKYIGNVRKMDSRVLVEAVNALDPDNLKCLESWCKAGQTIAFMGSSGVGKTTLVNNLGASNQKTGAIRKDDSKGRHTTTHRSLLPLKDGAILLDSPGIRELQIADCEVGLTVLFADIERLSQNCKFNDCRHDGEPKCAVEVAIQKGTLDTRRLKNFNKLMAEQRHNAATLVERRKADKDFGKLSKSAICAKKGKQSY